MNHPQLERKNQRKIVRFTFGSIFGLFIATLFWSCSVYFHASLAPAYSIAAIFTIAISFGAIATITSIDKLMDLMDNFPPI